MSTAFPKPSSAGKHLGRIAAVVGVCLAVAVLVRVGATFAFGERAPVASNAQQFSTVPGEIQATHALPISNDAQTHDEANPAPPTF